MISPRSPGRENEDFIEADVSVESYYRPNCQPVINCKKHLKIQVYTPSIDGISIRYPHRP